MKFITIPNPEAIVEGRKLQTGSSEALRLSYHDSCFLGRHNYIYQAPRDILAKAGAQITPWIHQGSSDFVVVQAGDACGWRKRR